MGGDGNVLGRRRCTSGGGREKGRSWRVSVVRINKKYHKWAGICRHGR